MGIMLCMVLFSCSGKDAEPGAQVSAAGAPAAQSEDRTEAAEATSEPSAESDLEEASEDAEADPASEEGIVTGTSVPAYEGEPSVPVNHNQPAFDASRMTEDSFEEYGKLDKRGRCTGAMASLCTDTQPKENEHRGDISSVRPSGWKSNQGWERCHLIGWQLSAENDNKRNLVTGTHYMNVDGMLPYENEVAAYIRETGNHVLYEVTPVFKGRNMICSGVQMQAMSVEDEGDGVSFNVFCFNVSPGREINYKTGEVSVTDEQLASENAFQRTYVLNTNTMKFHYPSCSSVASMAEHNKQEVHTSREELIRQGYAPCGVCEP